MKCAIIQDLLPLYCDDVLSPESTEAVKKHLESCAGCRKLYDDMLSVNPKLGQVMQEIRPLKKLRRRIKRTYIVMGIIMAVLLIANSLANVWFDPPRAKKKQLDPEVTVYAPELEVYTWENSAGDRFSAKFPKGAELVFDEQSNYVYCNGEQLIGTRHGTYTGGQELDTVPAETGGWVSPLGDLIIRVNVRTLYPYERVERYGYGNGEPEPVHAVLSIRPTFTTDRNIGGQGTDYPVEMSFAAYECGRGATLTILCRDGDIVLDLHQIAVAEGLLDE